MEYTIVVRLAKGYAVWLSSVSGCDLPYETARAARYSGRPVLVYGTEDFFSGAGYSLSATMANLPGGAR